MTSEQIDQLWDIDDPKAGFQALQKALAEHPGSADEIHTQICRSLGLQDKFAEGWAELAKVSDHPTDIVRIRTMLEAGRLRNSSGDPKAAVPHFQAALDLAAAKGFDFYAVDAAHMLGIATSGQTSVDWNEKALAMAASSADKRAQRWKGSLLNNLGWTYHDAGDFDKALEKFVAAQKFREEAGDRKRERIARYAVARCYRSMKRHTEALEILEDLIKGPEDGYVSEELGENLLAIGKKDEAKPHFKRAYELLSQDDWMKKNEAARLERLKQLGASD